MHTPEDLREVKLHVGRTIRAHRLRRGVSGRELASRIGVGQATISRIESGAVTPAPDTVESICNALHVDAVSTSDLVEQALKLSLKTVDMRTVDLRDRNEAALDRDRNTFHYDVYIPDQFPVFLQIAAYWRSLVEHTAPLIHPLTQRAIDATATVRMRRQALLLDASRTFRFLMHHTALEGALIQPHVMAAQLANALELSKRDNVELGFVPNDAPLLVGRSPFCVRDRSQAIVETNYVDLTINDRKEVRLLSEFFDNMWNMATTGDGALALMESRLQELHSLLARSS